MHSLENANAISRLRHNRENDMRALSTPLLSDEVIGEYGGIFVLLNFINVDRFFIFHYSKISVYLKLCEEDKRPAKSRQTSRSPEAFQLRLQRLVILEAFS